MDNLIKPPPGESYFDTSRLLNYANYLNLLAPAIETMAWDDNKRRVPEAMVDAIVVPQGRSAEHIRPAAKLAYRTGAMLISLCSHEAKATVVADVLGDMLYGPHRWYAVNVPDGYRIPDIELAAEHEIPDVARKDPGWNLSDKRNALLLLGTMTGSRGYFFHDDDNTIFPHALESVSLALYEQELEIAGLSCARYAYQSFPDKSMIMHARNSIKRFHVGGRWYSNELGAGQISANSMAINPQLVAEHFPRGAYNEDWQFALESIKRRVAGLSRATYSQEPYNPFVPERARQEEFGDLLIDGLYIDLKKRFNEGTSDDALYNATYWQSVIESRRRLYDALLDGTEQFRNPLYFSHMIPWEEVSRSMNEKEKMCLLPSLMAGIAVNETLRGKDFVGYTRVWQQEDRPRWEAMRESLPRNLSVTEALSRLDLTDFLTSDDPKRKFRLAA